MQEEKQAAPFGNDLRMLRTSQSGAAAADDERDMEEGQQLQLRSYPTCTFNCLHVRTTCTTLCSSLVAVVHEADGIGLLVKMAG